MASPCPMTQNLALTLVSLRPSQSQNYFATDSQSVSQPFPPGFMTKFGCGQDNCFLVCCGAFSLSRGRIFHVIIHRPCLCQTIFSQLFSVRIVTIWYDFSTDRTENMPECHLTSVPQGHDTTSAGMCWALFLLGLHPDIQVSVKMPKSLFCYSDSSHLKFLDILNRKKHSRSKRTSSRGLTALPPLKTSTR